MLEVGDPHGSALGADRLLRQHAMAEGLRNRLGAHELVGTERTGDRRFEDVKLTRVGRVSEQRRRHAEVLAQNLGRDMLEPVAEQKRVVLVEVAIVEDEQEFASVLTEALDRMRNAAGKIPEVADAHVVDKVAALRVDRGDARRSVEHVGPFGLLVPVKLADSAGVEPHVHARDRFRNAKLPRGHLARPPAARLPHMRVREGKPEIGQGSRIGRRRIEKVWVLSLASDVAGHGIGAADAGRPTRLGNLIGGLSRRGGHRRARDHGGREKITSREFTHRFSFGCTARFPPAQRNAVSCARVLRVTTERDHNGVMKIQLAAHFKCLPRNASVRVQASAALGAS